MQRIHLLMTASLAILAPTVASHAQTLTILHDFKGGKDGAFPLPGSSAAFISDAAGNLYGETAGLDVATDLGTIFELMPPRAGKMKWTEQTLYRFKGGADGDYPGAALLSDSAGGFYSTTVEGGTGSCSQFGTQAGCGTVFHLLPPASGKTAWTDKVLHTFKSGTDGAFPPSNLIEDAAGALYGTTSAGGGGACNILSPGCGIIFRLQPPAPGATRWTETVLHAFQGGTDGNLPESGLTMDASGNLYGTTGYGGSSGCGGAGCGLLYELSPPPSGQTAWKETILYTFQGGTDGGLPQPAPVLDHAGHLLGTALIGGAGFGTAYKLSPPKTGQANWTFSVLYAFRGSPDAASPDAGLTDDGTGAYVTTTYSGGTGPCATQGSATGCGTIVKLLPPAAGSTAWTETVLHSLNGTTEGAVPGGGILAGPSGVLYTAAEEGGDPTTCPASTVPGCGTALSLSP